MTHQAELTEVATMLITPPTGLTTSEKRPLNHYAEVDVFAPTAGDDWEPYGTAADPAHDLPTLATWHWVEVFCVLVLFLAWAIKAWWGV